ncbi:hypothetical protein GDO86_016291 [Hymenochirus boettgeri]|uniref:Diphthine--ammonia ligase n=1 Tax=Hymenochirus boettgeri TaxID=247094 RepID=A0A8T2K4U9_9PIPI|nr:hypothetical protein GDO86_016291 [Hymenochirus boettgeri]
MTSICGACLTYCPVRAGHLYCVLFVPSGGKDSCYNMMQCVSAGHQIVALANLRPPESTVDEIDSYMYQTVGHHALDLYAEAMGLPLYRATLQGTSLDTGRSYIPQEGDEVEDLYQLLKLVKLSDRFGVHICGEGGEYETLTLDCPLFRKRIVVDSEEVMMHSNDAFAPVAYLRLSKLHLEDKPWSPMAVLEGDCSCTTGWPEVPLICSTEQYGDEKPFFWIPSGLPLMSSCERKKCSARSQNGFQWASEVTTTGGNVMDTVSNGLTSLKDQVKELGLQMKDAVLVHLYIRKMEDFATINREYGTLFPTAPPARVCLQCGLHGDAFFKMDVLFFSALPAEHSIHSESKVTMHVQSLSHWAPANIGPYSQAVRVGSTLFCAGQIALIPCTMLLVTGGIAVEVGISLHHVESVLEALNTGTTLKHVLLAHCYVTSCSAIPTAIAAWKSKFAHEADALPLSIAVVPKLPRGASVEWHVVATVSDPEEKKSFTVCQESSSYQAILHGVLSSCFSCASFSLSLSLTPSGDSCQSQEWQDVCVLLQSALYRATKELPSETILTPLCCRVFYRNNGLEAYSLHAGLQEVLEEVWPERSPALVLVPVMNLLPSEVLNLSLWLSL